MGVEHGEDVGGDLRYIRGVEIGTTVACRTLLQCGKGPWSPRLALTRFGGPLPMIVVLADAISKWRCGCRIGCRFSVEARFNPNELY
jgi:hypothetical protein